MATGHGSGEEVGWVDVATVIEEATTRQIIEWGKKVEACGKQVRGLGLERRGGGENNNNRRGIRHRPSNQEVHLGQSRVQNAPRLQSASLEPSRWNE